MPQLARRLDVDDWVAGSVGGGLRRCSLREAEHHRPLSGGGIKRGGADGLVGVIGKQLRDIAVQAKLHRDGRRRFDFGVDGSGVGAVGEASPTVLLEEHP